MVRTLACLTRVNAAGVLRLAICAGAIQVPGATHVLAVSLGVGGGPSAWAAQPDRVNRDKVANTVVRIKVMVQSNQQIRAEIRFP